MLNWIVYMLYVNRNIYMINNITALKSTWKQIIIVGKSKSLFVFHQKMPCFDVCVCVCCVCVFFSLVLLAFSHSLSLENLNAASQFIQNSTIKWFVQMNSIPGLIWYNAIICSISFLFSLYMCSMYFVCFLMFYIFFLVHLIVCTADYYNCTHK